MTQTITHEVDCGCRNGLFRTALFWGQTGSSRLSPEAAVLQLATKLYGVLPPVTVECIDPGDALAPSRYRFTLGEAAA